jgi:serine/threonine-protein kinase
LALDVSRGPARAPLTGTRLGRYLLAERLGSGGSASVYLALLRGSHEFERICAVKVVHEHLSESREFVEMFLDEANIAVRLSHPNVVHTYELGQAGPHLFIAMEYLAGQPLSRVVERVRERGEVLPPSVVAWIGASAAAGLAYAHALTDEQGRSLGIVHRDVSPQNVFLTYDGRVVVIDFGIARADGRLTETALGRIKGKLCYMAPEQILRQRVDRRADLFSLGATLYEAAVGRLPYLGKDEAETIARLLEEDAPPPSATVPGFPSALSDVLARALAREPRDRYPDGAEMAKDLARSAAMLAKSEPQAELVVLLARLFAEERDAEARAVLRLRRTPSVRPMRAITTTADPTAVSIRPALPARRSRLGTALAVVSATFGLAALGAAYVERMLPDVLRPASEAETVALAVEVDPDVPATIVVDGRTASGRPARELVPRSKAPVVIGVDAPGFARAEVRAVPDHDRLIIVRLTRARPVAPPDTGGVPAAGPSVPSPKTP